MATLREQLAEMNVVINGTNERLNKEWQEVGKTAKVRDNLIYQVILDEKMFSSVPWTLTSDGFLGKVHFGVLSRHCQDLQDKLSQIWHFDYHDRLDLAEGIEMSIDDGDVSLSFKDAVTAFQFIKDQGLKVDIAGLLDEQSNYQAKLDRVTTLINSIKTEMPSNFVVIEEKKITRRRANA